MTYDVLAVLWAGPGTEIEVVRGVGERLGTPISRNAVDAHLRLLRTTGHVRTLNLAGTTAYALTESGSELLSTLAENELHVCL